MFVVVENVEPFRTELQAEALSQFELLAYRRIQVPCPWAPKGVPGIIPAGTAQVVIAQFRIERSKARRYRTLQ